MSTADIYLASGLSVLPADPKRKCPVVPSWKEFRERLPKAEELAAWFRSGDEGLCLVCGRISGNLETIDFDNHGELFGKWAEALPQELFDRLAVERTPSGGFHATYRCSEPVGGNAKLATGTRDGRRATLIETRGEGGIVLCAPTVGYVLRQGGYDRLPVLSPAERDILLDAARALDESAEDEPDAVTPECRTAPGTLLRPGDDYNARGDFRSLLMAHGWKPLHTADDGNEHWRRPDKRTGSSSATLRDGSFYVFSSNAAPFEPGRSYSPFMAYTLLEHGGDCAEAAAALVREGYGAAARENAAIDWNALGAGKPPRAEPAQSSWTNEYPDPGKLPERLTHIPGFIDEFVEWSMSSAPHPNRVLEFCGALAFLSYIAGRKVKSDRNILPNIYLVALAESGTGKDHPRKVNIASAVECNAGNGVIEDITSGAALEDLLFLNPAVLFQKDEIDTMFNSIKMSKDPSSETMLGKLLTIFGASNSIYRLRDKAVGRAELMKMRSDSREGMRPQAPVVQNPYLVIFGTAIPKFFYESLSPRILGNGMAARCIILDAEKRGKPNRPKLIEMPEGIRRTLEVIDGYSGGNGNLEAINPDMLVLKATPDADALLDEIALRFDEKYHRYDAIGEPAPMSFWARANEKTVKLAMLYAISANAASPVITKEAVKWANDFVDFTTRQALFLAGSYSYENPFDEKKQKVLRLLRRRNGECPHSELLRCSRESAELFGKIMETLIAGEEVVCLERETGGKKMQKYYLLSERLGEEGKSS